MKLFISTPMHGFTDDEIKETFKRIRIKAAEFFKDENIATQSVVSNAPKWFAWMSAISTFQAARNTWLTYKYLDGEICSYDWTIVVNDDKDDEVDEI